MTIEQVITNVRKIKSGYDISDEMIIGFINTVEMSLIINEIIGRENDKIIASTYGSYDIETDRDKQLLAKAPFDNIYQAYCVAQIDIIYEETERYQNDMIVYNMIYDEFSKYWCKTHRQNKKYNYHN